MSLFTFPPGSAVARVQFHYALDRLPEALLTASSAADAAHLASLTRAMREFGWQCTPAFVDGQEILQVTGFKDAEQFVALLNLHHAVSGPPVVTQEPSDDLHKTTKSWLQHNSLRSAGGLNLIGDAGLLFSGISHGDAEKISAGSLYTAGALVAARYGNVRTEHQVREVLRNTEKFLKRQALDLPPESGLAAMTEAKKHSRFEDVENFLHHYPAEVMLGAYTLGAFSMFQSGLRKRGPDGQILNPWNIAYGATSIGLKAATLAIPEHHMNAEEKLQAQGHSPIHKVVDWIQEKPMRLFGFGSLVSDTLLGLSAYRDAKNNPAASKNAFMWITTGTYIMADILAAISSKSPANADGRFNADEQRRVLATIAETIAGQPAKMQEALTNQVSGFLAMQPEIRGDAAMLSATISEQMQHLQKNPWAARARASAADSPQIQL